MKVSVLKSILWIEDGRLKIHFISHDLTSFTINSINWHVIFRWVWIILEEIGWGSGVKGSRKDRAWSTLWWSHPITLEALNKCKVIMWWHPYRCHNFSMELSSFPFKIVENNNLKINAIFIKLNSSFETWATLLSQYMFAC